MGTLDTKRNSATLRTQSGPPGRLDRFAWIAVLSLFGLTWPVLELLANNAEFFLARRSTKAEMAVLAVTLLAVIPAILAVTGSLPGKAGKAVFAVLSTLAAASLFLLVARRSPLPAWASAALSVAAGALVTFGFWRRRLLGRVARVLLVSPAVLLIVYLFATPAGAVLLDGGSTVGSGTEIANPAPVVVVVFDEFPVASIIDPDGNLRADRYPGFARLADDGIWYPNAVTVQQQTEHSVPAIVTGSNPSQSLTPFAGQYPNSLFTMLGGSYELDVREAITQLCPVTLCEHLTPSATPVVHDVAVVAGHLLLPEPMSAGLPSIDATWGDFAATSRDFEARSEFRAAMGSRLSPIEAFIEGLEKPGDGRPALHFLHGLIPHHPWQMLPDGHSYPIVTNGNPGSRGGGWVEDEWLVIQGMQRHLLQVGYADHIVTRIIEALERSGSYDETLIVVIADHGISIKPGVGHQRKITPDTVGEIAAVPLFVKPPHSREGAVDTRRALTIDILPTIVDVLDATPPFDMEGVSLLGPDPGRTETTIIGPERSVTFDASGREKLEVAARVEEWFPGGDPWAARPGGSPDLLGAAVTPEDLPIAVGVRATIENQAAFSDLDPSGASLPAQITGVLTGSVDGTEILAVTVNGEVGAITRSYEREGVIRYQAMIPPDLITAGDNEIGLILVADDDALTRLVTPDE